MSCNKYSLLNIGGFSKAGPRKNFNFKPVRSAKNVADPCFRLQSAPTGKRFRWRDHLRPCLVPFWCGNSITI